MENEKLKRWLEEHAVKQHACPTCGRCPTCGQPRTAPNVIFIPVPTPAPLPQPYLPPHDGTVLPWLGNGIVYCSTGGVPC